MDTARQIPRWGLLCHTPRRLIQQYNSLFYLLRRKFRIGQIHFDHSCATGQGCYHIRAYSKISSPISKQFVAEEL
jgi:hypothetical protein